MINDFSKKKIIKILKELDIKKNDDLMIHGDSAIIYQYNINKKRGFSLFFQTIEDYIKKGGTILIPSFTFSFCKTKKFDRNLTKSQTGNFSQTFGKRINVKRTNHPIFSFYIKGKNWDYYNKAKLDICFGKDSIFDLFHKKNGKIIVLGNSFEKSTTFLHHIEEQAKVKYRFYKFFKGEIIDNNKKKELNVSYYVKKLSLNIKLKFKKSLFKKLKKANFKRFQVYSIASKKLYNYCMKKLKKDKKYLINNYEI